VSLRSFEEAGLVLPVCRRPTASPGLSRRRLKSGEALRRASASEANGSNARRYSPFCFALSIEGPEWARDAACADLTPEEADRLFFPERGHSTGAGRALCARCPVSPGTPTAPRSKGTSLSAAR